MIGRKKAAAPNPFLRPPAGPVARIDESSGEEMRGAGPVMVQGAPAPSGAPAPEEPLLALPGWVTSDNPWMAPDAPDPAAQVQVVGLHGGAGASHVDALLGPHGVDCGAGLSGLRSSKLPVLLVARTHGAGLHAASRAGQQWAAGGLAPVEVLGLVLVDDAPELGAELERAVHSAQRLFPRSWRLGWCEAWRLDPALPDPEDKTCPRRARQVRKSVLAACAESRGQQEQEHQINLEKRKTS